MTAFAYSPDDLEIGDLIYNTQTRSMHKYLGPNIHPQLEGLHSAYGSATDYFMIEPGPTIVLNRLTVDVMEADPGILEYRLIG